MAININFEDFVAFLIFIIICACLFFTGTIYGEYKMKKIALQSKVAEYYIDENNNKQFRFKEIK